MEDIGQRLKEFIDEKELSVLSFSERVGIQRSSLSHLFSGRNKPSIDLLLKIKKQYPDIDLDWLISGQAIKKEAYTNSASEKSDELQVTNVNKEVLKTNIQSVRTDEKALGSKNTSSSQIERIIIFNKNGSFNEYKND